MITQLSLGFQLRNDATFESYFSAENLQAFKAIHDMVEGIGEPFLYLWGGSDIGKTHLLQASCHAVLEHQQTAVYVPLKQYRDCSVQILQGLEYVSLICLDDVHTIAGDAEWEEQILHLYNRIRLEGGRLLVSANSSPTSIPIELPDLKSRLSSGMTFQVKPLNDDQKLATLKIRAHELGLELDNSVGKFLIRRCARNLTKLFQTLGQLDQASMIEQRRLTIPFVKQVLGV